MGPPPCPLCQQNHSLDYCKQFGEMDERLSLAREKNRCEFCLRGGQEKEKCYTRAKCYECVGNHRFLFHGGADLNSAGQPDSPDGQRCSVTSGSENGEKGEMPASDRAGGDYYPANKFNDRCFGV